MSQPAELERKAKAKDLASRAIDPIARGLLKLHVSADAVTITGTLGAVVAALWCFPTGHLVAGAIIVSLFAFSDMIDGSMARQAGKVSEWGAFLDSLLDRVTDAAIFAGLTIWFLGNGNEPILGYASLYCLAAGQVISYARARAEGLGLKASGGIAERTERLVLVLTVTVFSGLGVPFVQAIGLWVLVAAITATVIQRMIMVRRQVS